MSSSSITMFVLTRDSACMCMVHIKAGGIALELSDDQRGECFQHKNDPESSGGVRAHSGECESACSMPNVSRWPRCESFSPPATLSASPELAAGDIWPGRAHLACPAVPAVVEERQGRRAPLSRKIRVAACRRLLADSTVSPQRNRVSPPQRRRSPRRYTPNDIALLAARSTRPRRALGAAVRHILRREYTVFNKAAYQVSLDLGVPHHTCGGGRPTSTPRSCPRPRGVDRRAAQARPARPARLAGRHGASGRHRRGPLPHQRCRYVTQWQVVGCCETISEAHLIRF